jgi:hypothetical protein
MPIAMGDQFKGLPMGDLIGGPLMAACDAQVRLANATAGFIQQIAFLPTDPTKPVNESTNPLKVREVAFRFSRPRALTAAEADSQASRDPAKEFTVPFETVELTVPMLAIVKVPSLAINTVDITFDMEVKNTERTSQVDESKGSFAADASVGWGPFKLTVHVEGSVSSHKENTRQTDQSAKYHVEVRAEDKGMPEGLARVLDMMNSAIAPHSLAPRADTAKAGALTGPAGDARLISSGRSESPDTQRRSEPMPEETRGQFREEDVRGEEEFYALVRRVHPDEVGASPAE